MVCSIIDECRCFAYDDVADPRKSQFCGVRRGPNVMACPENDCCAGGCPGQVPGLIPREPFRIIERPSSFRMPEYNPELYILIMLIIFSLLFLTYLT
ncbi:hypothetical protein OtV6_128 [Ostreococcus tauri virus RT-2011]|nr:hypothetical protein OtV6_128 [Ostreococcus tauri virus RT-2011]